MIIEGLYRTLLAVWARYREHRIQRATLKIVSKELKRLQAEIARKSQ